jgi:sporulation protein YlmC with PRC-barrel domain
MILSATSLRKNPVRNPEGKDLGNIEDFMLNTDNGEVEYAVLSFGGWLGVGDKLFAVPLEAMQLDTESKCFILNESKERLKDAPGFDKDNWPGTSATDFHTQVDRYYGV